VVSTPIVLFAVLMVLLYIPPVQNFLRKQATALASEATDMDISVERSLSSMLAADSPASTARSLFISVFSI